MSIAENIALIREQIARAADRAKRDPDEITLMAVTKTHPPEVIREAYSAGVRWFGENKVQEFTGKIAAFSDLQDAEFHMIGHLQSNKAAKAAELFPAIDSVDSLRLAEKLNTTAAQLNKTLNVLIEINIGGESAKSGIDPASVELEEILRSAPGLQNLRFSGVMTVPPFIERPEDSRSYFRKLRELKENIASRKLSGVPMNVLSMGMSHDFEVAIEEGSTCVRVGTAIFGERNKS